MITRASGAWVGLAVVLCVSPAPIDAQDLACIAPVPPFLPGDPRDVRTYAELLRQDFETYIADFDTYLRCLDAERARVFEEGRAVVQDYARLQQLTRTLR